MARRPSSPPARRTPACPAADDVGRGELVLLPLIVLLAFALRAAYPARMAVEHFDEGVYASNLYSAGQHPPFVYPDRHLYAPPLLPGLLEWALLLTGRPESVMWVNVLAGAVMAAVVGWGVRSWFGPAAGIGAALLAATSEYHIAFSRMALTDVLLGLFLAGGVFAGWRAVVEGRPVWIAVAGVLAGLAWWTKYNGWLTLAITGSGTAAWLLTCRERPISAVSALLRWGGTALIAVACWTPFLWTIPDGSSYADIRANHARYFVGISGWWSAAGRHLETLRYLDGWFTWGGVVLAVGVGCCAGRRRFTWNTNAGPVAPRHGVWRTAIAVAAAWAMAAAGVHIVLAALSAAGVLAVVVPALGRRWPGSPSGADPANDADSNSATQLGWWMAAAWFTGLLVATPLYHPYPRLLLPWVMSLWVLGSAAITRLACWPAASSEPASAGRKALWPAVAIPVLVAGVWLAATWRGAPLIPPQATAWQDRGGLGQVAASILRDARSTVAGLGSSGRPEVDAVFYVYAEPALFFHLQAAAPTAELQFVASPATSLELHEPAEVPVFLMIGPHAQREGAERHPALRAYRRIATYDYSPSDLVQLDEVGAAALTGAARPLPETVRLYLVHGPLPSP